MKNKLLKPEEDIANEVFENEDFSNSTISSKNIDKIVFNNCDFTNVKFDTCILDGITFNNCDLSMVEFVDGGIHRCKFKNTKLVGANIGKSSMRNVIVEECYAKYFNLYQTRTSRLFLKSSNFTEARFYDCVLAEAIFDSVNFLSAEFLNTSLSGVDLSETEISGLRIKEEDIKGAIISIKQTPLVATLFGLKIKD